MRTKVHLRFVVGLAVLCPLLIGTALGAQTKQVAEATTVVFLTRHAEAEYPFEKDPRNPPLTEIGHERAQALAHALSGAGVTEIWSTDYQRTRSTAAPLAERTGLDVEIYDGRALEDAARRLRSRTGRIYVAGHSNTTPELVALLGGDPGPEIDHVWEHDRLYVVTLGEGGRFLSSVMVRFGPASVPPAAESP